MDIYTDYANWKFENYDFISSLVLEKSATIARFTSVIAVVDYLYEEYVKTKSLTSDEELIFSTGFDYIYDNFYTIQTICELNFNNDIKEMEKYARNINLLLYINEFKAELKENKIDSSKLDNFSDDVSEGIEKKKAVPDEYFIMLDEITKDLFEKNGIEVYTVEQIFYEIAVEYDIYPEEDYDAFNSFLNNKIEGKI